MKPETGVYRLSPKTFSIVISEFDTEEEAIKYLKRLKIENF